MKIEILQLIEGATRAKGLTVVIDVFRAFSLEAYAWRRLEEKRRRNGGNVCKI